jgi:hypothetical protein
MAKRVHPRKKISFVVLVIIGLLLGMAIKHVAIGIIIGVIFGFLMSGFAEGGRKKDDL